MNIAMCQGPGGRPMDPFLQRNSLHIKVIDVDSDDYVTTHMIQGGGELLDWTLVKKFILSSAQTQTLGAADLSCARQDWGSVLAQNADGSCTRTCSCCIRVSVGRAKRFCKTMEHARVGSGADSPFTRGCTLVPVLCFSSKEQKQKKHALALSAAVLEQNAYLDARQVRRIDVPAFCNLCATDSRRTPLMSRIHFDNETYEKAGIAFGNHIEQMGPISGSAYCVKWLYEARTKLND